MAGKRRRPPKTSDVGVHYLGRCQPCGKLLWDSRTAARSVAKSNHPGEHMSVYRCPVSDGWHYGHLHPHVVAGAVDRDTKYGRMGSAQ